MKKNINEDIQAVNPSLYKNTDFRDGVVGKSKPSKDLINPSLLADVDKAATLAGVKVSVTTAVSGHKPKGRHPQGNAVDIAMVNGKGFSSMGDAKSRGIYDAIIKFVDELVKMGYTKNSESGNDKAVLTFGFKDHDNHVHVSRKSGGGVSSTNQSLSSIDMSSEEPSSIDEPSDISSSSTNDFEIKSWSELMAPVKGALQKLGLKEEVEVIKNYNKKLTPNITEKLSRNDKIGDFTIISDNNDHAKRPLGNWSSDNAWDLKAPIGTSVHSFTKGVVSKIFQSGSGNVKKFGTQVSISGTDGYTDIFYTHLDSVSLKPGDKVNVGDFIGKITRWDYNPSGSHVHVGLKTGDLGDLASGNPNMSGSTISSDNQFTPSSSTSSSGDFGIKSWSELMAPVKGVLQKLGLKEEVNRFQRLSNSLNESITFSNLSHPVQYSKVISLSKQVVVLKVEPNSSVVSPYKGEVIEKTYGKVVIKIVQKYDEFKLTIYNLRNIKVNEGDGVDKGSVIGKTDSDKIKIEINKGDIRPWFNKKEVKPTKDSELDIKNFYNKSVDLDVKNLYDKETDLNVRNLYDKETDLNVKNLYDKETDLNVKNVFSKNINEDIEKIKRLLK